MALEWDAVEKIRAAQARRDTDIVPSTSDNDRAALSPGGSAAKIPALTDLESMIFKIRAQLIDYIVAHGLVDGLIFDGTLRATESGKIVITSEMIDVVTDALGYYKESDVLAFVERYLPDHHYVTDANYVHTDNNYDHDAVDKLGSIEYGAEVNKIIDLVFNGSTVVDPDTRVATITITPEMIKEWYESNDDTNAFTDEAKQELASLWERLDYLDAKVDDVQLDGESIVKNKIAYLTALKLKNSYESNPDTNAYTDAAKAIVESIPALRTRVDEDEQRIDALERAVAILQSDLAQEIVDRETGDKNLHTEIVTEASARAEKDQELNTLIADESLARANADQILEREIVDLGEDLGRTKDNVTALARDIAFERDTETESTYKPRETVTELWLDRVGGAGEKVTEAYVHTAADDPGNGNDKYKIANKEYVSTAISNIVLPKYFPGVFNLPKVTDDLRYYVGKAYKQYEFTYDPDSTSAINHIVFDETDNCYRITPIITDQMFQNIFRDAGVGPSSYIYYTMEYELFSVRYTDRTGISTELFKVEGISDIANVRPETKPYQERTPIVYTLQPRSRDVGAGKYNYPLSMFFGSFKIPKTSDEETAIPRRLNVDVDIYLYAAIRDK